MIIGKNDGKRDNDNWNNDKDGYSDSDNCNNDN